MQHRVYGDEYRQTILCIDSYENNIPVGRIYNLHRSEGVPFQGIVPFLTRMEDTLNDLEFPKSFTAARSFGPAPEGLEEKPLPESAREGREATFLLRIVFRQNASWQGSVTWLEGKRNQSFRSVLELILLVDSALRMDRQQPEVSSA